MITQEIIEEFFNEHFPTPTKIVNAFGKSFWLDTIPVDGIPSKALVTVTLHEPARIAYHKKEVEESCKMFALLHNIECHFDEIE